MGRGGDDLDVIVQQISQFGQSHVAFGLGRGGFDGGHIDADIHFWKQFKRDGHKLGLATQVSVGHAELMITWPSRQSPDCKVLQHTTDYWVNGQKAPERAWGQVR